METGSRNQQERVLPHWIQAVKHLLESNDTQNNQSREIGLLVGVDEIGSLLSDANAANVVNLPVGNFNDHNTVNQKGYVLGSEKGGAS